MFVHIVTKKKNLTIYQLSGLRYKLYRPDSRTAPADQLFPEHRQREFLFAVGHTCIHKNNHHMKWHERQNNLETSFFNGNAMQAHLYFLVRFIRETRSQTIIPSCKQTQSSQ